MKILSVHHETTYAYPDAVQHADHLAFLRPSSGHYQTVLAQDLQVQPEPDLRQHSRDSFGNLRDVFGLYARHDHLKVIATSRVQTRSLGDERLLRDHALAWRDLPARLGYAAGRPYVPASEFSFSSPHVPEVAAIRDYALEVFNEEPGLAAACLKLTRRIHAEFRYAPQTTAIDTPVHEAFRRREGVCQDFAHIMLSALRGLGLSARYVSGYLLTRPPAGQPRRQGADASHAWVSVWCPGLADDWVEFDPTNGIVAGDEHVRLAYGRDFDDVSPLRGVIRGGAEHRLSVAVTVEEEDATEDPVDLTPARGMPKKEGKG